MKMAKLLPQVSPQLVMSEDEWKELWKRLKLITYKHYGWLLNRIRGLDLDEVILDAIEDTFFCIRQWPPIDSNGEIKDVALLYFLCQTIRSKISNLIKQSQRHVSIQDEMNAEHFVSLEQSSLLSIQAKGESDEQARYNQLSEMLLKSVRSDPLLERIVNLHIVDPGIKPREIAHNLGVSIRQVQNAQKRLNRRVRRIRYAVRGVRK
jgi:DNA-directed RNA polymerase specialized sigma24 family protein